MWTSFPWGIWNDWRLGSDAPVTVGQISSAEETNLSLNGTKVWRYLFEFRPEPDAAALRRECYTTGSRWGQGDRVIVRYLPDGWLAVVEGARSTESAGWLVFTVCFPLFGAYLAWSKWQRQKRIIVVLAHGRWVDARVVAVEKQQQSAGYKPEFKVVFKVPDLPAPITLKFSCLNSTQVTFAETELVVGGKVDALIDPRFPREIVLPRAL